jgi:alkylhydroperoxidase family enzyme
MTTCRVEMLEPEAAVKAAETVGLLPTFVDLHIFRVLLHRPRTAKALADLLISLLFGGELNDRLRELLIMRIGWTTGSDYEWTQHWAIAQNQFGCTEQDLLELRDWRTSAHFSDDDKTLLEATDELLETGSLSEALTETCKERFGQNATIELVTAVGCWQLVSKFTKALEVPLEEGIVSWPPDGTKPDAA